MTVIPMNTYVQSSLDSNLQQPIAIPATDVALGSPFLRAYPLGLEAFGITSSSFLSFLDELNHIIVVSPPVRALSLAGDVVGLVPLATAQIVGASVNAAAEIGAYAISKGRSELFLSKSNKTIFAPRGLRADIVKLEVVAKEAGIPILNAEGKIAKDTQLLVPIEDLQTNMSGQERRLMTFAHWTGPLQMFPNDDQVVQLNWFDKMNAAASERQRSKEEAKTLERRTKGQGQRQKKLDKLRDDFDKDVGKLRKEETKLKEKEAKKPEKPNKELHKLEEKRARVQREYDKEVEHVQGVHGNAVKKDKEEKAVRKVLWLLIQEQRNYASASAHVS